MLGQVVRGYAALLTCIAEVSRQRLSALLVPAEVGAPATDRAGEEVADLRLRVAALERRIDHLGPAPRPHGGRQAGTATGPRGGAR